MATETPCRESQCCPTDDLDHSSSDAQNCPDGYIWNGEECVPTDCIVLTTELPDGEVGVEYSASVTAEGEIMQFNWSIQGGGLPPGLTLNADGTITGTPTEGGTYEFTVEATPYV